MKLDDAARCTFQTFVYEVEYTYDYYHRVFHPSGDSDATGHVTKETGHLHIAAKTPDLARAQFRATRASTYDIVSVTPICSLDYYVRV